MKKKLSCILLIDDDEPTNFLNKLTITENGYADYVQVVPGGQEALDYLTNSGPFNTTEDDFPRPELIFLDINMPSMDGWEFLEHYKKLKQSEIEKIIMVMLTTSLNPDDRRIASEDPNIAGFELKPLTAGTLEKIIDRYFPS